MSEVQFTEDDLNDFLEQAKTIPSAEAVYVLQPEGEVVCHQGTCENVDTAYFTKYTDDCIGSDSLEFQGNSYAFIMEKESEPGSAENRCGSICLTRNPMGRQETCQGCAVV
ncbi:hypothetical protein EBI_26776 [Enterocytozoon bieneusi H348]|nr:hypothetical protein EBI_26776 [Enterocytozoon bieneusi H348]|eukprot:XP_002652020.1 hypothetical protein EBI_26776 [Enterocytozoon bieneusi H348]